MPSKATLAIFLTLYVCIASGIVRLIYSLITTWANHPNGIEPMRIGGVGLLIFLAYLLYKRNPLGWILAVFCSLIWLIYQAASIYMLYKAYQRVIAMSAGVNGPVWINADAYTNPINYWMTIGVPFSVLIWLPMVRKEFRIGK